MDINFIEYFYVINIEKEMSFSEVTRDTVNVQEKQKRTQMSALGYSRSQPSWKKHYST